MASAWNIEAELSRHQSHLEEAARWAYQDENADHACRENLELLDLRGDIRRVIIEGCSLVFKRRPAASAEEERRRALTARARLAGLIADEFGNIRVVVPELVRLSASECALVTPDLGSSLAETLRSTAVVFSPMAVRNLLGELLARGVDASGCVPRNLFLTDAGLAMIDWEDARFGPGLLRPSVLTLMKWDVAWSDVFGCDLKLREHFEPASPTDDAELDGFEVALRELTGCASPAQEVRALGVEATLCSELHVPGVAGVSAAELGHLAEDVLPPKLSVFHTLLTAHVRRTRGEPAYAALLQELGRAVEAHPALRSRKPVTNQGQADLSAAWIRTLCCAADKQLDEQPWAEPKGGTPGVATAAERLAALAPEQGWHAACARAALAEALLARIANLVTCSLGLDLQLILRGSLAQGVLGQRSDIDFELSSPTHPAGHHGAEGLVIDILACFGLAAEGSAARPVEADIKGSNPAVSRDLHEWFELRRPGSHQHDPGWVAQALRPSRDRLVIQQSEYEGLGRQHSAKYLWFEARAALARLVFREHPGTPPVTLPEQLDLLPSLIGSALAAEIRQIVLASFDQREQASPDLTVCVALQHRLDRLRALLSLPGPRPESPMRAEPAALGEEHS